MSPCLPHPPPGLFLRLRGKNCMVAFFKNPDHNSVEFYEMFRNIIANGIIMSNGWSV